MHQTKKGNQWYFGMKAHFGVDSRTKPIHAVVATPANVADSTILPDLLSLAVPAGVICPQSGHQTLRDIAMRHQPGSITPLRLP
jgi:IS5 family transposase